MLTPSSRLSTQGAITHQKFLQPSWLLHLMILVVWLGCISVVGARCYFAGCAAVSQSGAFDNALERRGMPELSKAE